MRPGIISWLAVVPLSVALVSATVAQPGEAKAKHKHHHAACSKMSCENGKDLLSVAKKEGNLTIFLGDVKTAGLCCTLCGKGPYTVFAESDSVFHGLPKGASGIGGEKADVEKTIKYHISERQSFCSRSERQAFSYYFGRRVTNDRQQRRQSLC